MARSGLQRGFNQGILQGVKTGLGMAGQRTGYAGGLTDGTANMDKLQDPVLLTGVKTGLGMGSARTGFAGGITDGTAYSTKLQDPVLLTGVKKPRIYCNADNVTTNTGLVITLTDLIASGFTLTNALGTNNTPDLDTRSIFNLRNSLDFNNAVASLYPTPAFNLNGKTEYSVMMVIKIDPATGYIFQVQDLLNPGSLVLQVTNTSQTIRSTFYGGQPGSLTTSVYETAGISQAERQDWMILTVKCRLSQPGGVGSEQEVYINGTLKEQLVSSNFNVITTTMAATSTFVIGNDREDFGSQGGNIHLGAFLMTDYWLNESEQLRLENYFRDYYGHKF